MIKQNIDKMIILSLNVKDFLLITILNILEMCCYFKSMETNYKL